MRRSNFAVGAALLTACAGQNEMPPSRMVVFERCAVRPNDWFIMTQAPANRDQLMALSYRGALTSSYLGVKTMGGLDREVWFMAVDDRVRARDGELMVCRYSTLPACGVPQAFFRQERGSWSVITHQEAACLEE